MLCEGVQEKTSLGSDVCNAMRFVSIHALYFFLPDRNMLFMFFVAKPGDGFLMGTNIPYTKSMNRMEIKPPY